jgi:hypothetical protein
LYGSFNLAAISSIVIPSIPLIIGYFKPFYKKLKEFAIILYKHKAEFALFCKFFENIFKKGLTNCRMGATI